MKIVILGCGRLGRQLIKAFAVAGVPPAQIYNRSAHRVSQLSKDLGIPFTTDLASILPDADHYIVSVSDQAIGDVSQELSHIHQEAIVTHTSGNTSTGTFKPLFQKYGLFYPLDTYSDDHPADFSKLPFILNASDEDTLHKLEQLARILSHNIHFVEDDHMSHLHLAAVFANNFSNKMIDIAFSILRDADLNEEMIKPLIASNFRKIKDNDPSEVQTGPAIRGDANTIRDHLNLLNYAPEWADIYKKISLLINRDIKDDV